MIAYEYEQIPASRTLCSWRCVSQGGSAPRVWRTLLGDWWPGWCKERRLHLRMTWPWRQPDRAARTSGLRGDGHNDTNNKIISPRKTTTSGWDWNPPRATNCSLDLQMQTESIENIVHCVLQYIFKIILQATIPEFFVLNCERFDAFLLVWIILLCFGFLHIVFWFSQFLRCYTLNY